MFRRRSKQQNLSEYANCSDFKQIFTQDMAGLHLLAFLLTADHDKAEECFVAGLEDSIKGNPVFREWARSWSKRAIIKRAIKMLAPSPADPRTGGGFSFDSGPGERDVLVASVTALAPFQRFVFAMSVLEGYSATECALLLHCTVKEVVAARAEGLQHVSLRRAADFSQAGRPVTWKEFLPATGVA